MIDFKISDLKYGDRFFFLIALLGSTNFQISFFVLWTLTPWPRNLMNTGTNWRKSTRLVGSLRVIWHQQSKEYITSYLKARALFQNISDIIYSFTVEKMSAGKTSPLLLCLPKLKKCWRQVNEQMKKIESAVSPFLLWNIALSNKNSLKIFLRTPVLLKNHLRRSNV